MNAGEGEVQLLAYRWLFSKETQCLAHDPIKRVVCFFVYFLRNLVDKLHGYVRLMRIHVLVAESIGVFKTMFK